LKLVTLVVSWKMEEVTLLEVATKRSSLPPELNSEGEAPPASRARECTSANDIREKEKAGRRGELLQTD
jgi:hypothetical protein